MILNFEAFSQDSTKTIKGKTYGKFGDNWYTVTERGKGYRVDLNHLVVRLNTRGSMQNFDPKEIELEHLKITRDNFAANYYELEIPSKLDPFNFAELLESTQMFEKILFNVFARLNADPNDPIFENQWNLDRIDITNAWEVIRGSDQIIIGVIDVGGDYDHEDLIDNKWGTTGGYDFIFDDNNPYPDDGAKHGTAVAGVIAAASNIASGIYFYRIVTPHYSLTKKMVQNLTSGLKFTKN